MMPAPRFRLNPGDLEYPLGAASTIRRPAALDGSGNQALLSAKCIGICGSRSASGSALRYAAEFGRLAAQAGVVVISGYAKGIDRTAHAGALAGGGATIAVLPEGLDAFRAVKDVRDLITNHNFLALSPFESSAVWTAYRAMDRNKYIVALSLGLFVIEARATGGTLNAGIECLRQGKPIWVVDYPSGAEERAGNRILISKGGMPVRTMRDLKAILATLPVAAWPLQRALPLGI